MPNPFDTNSAASFPAAAESGATAADTPASSVAPAPNSADPVSADEAAAVIEPASPVMAAAQIDPQDLIDEIFIGAARLQPRELPSDFQERLLAAIESDDVWVDEPPLFLRDQS
jgi:hypothetical protein